jgi:hypothetical protein
MVLDHPHHLCGQISPANNLFVWWLAADLNLFCFFLVLVWVDPEVCSFCAIPTVLLVVVLAVGLCGF